MTKMRYLSRGLEAAGCSSKVSACKTWFWRSSPNCLFISYFKPFFTRLLCPESSSPSEIFLPLIQLPEKPFFFPAARIKFWLHLVSYCIDLCLWCILHQMHKDMAPYTKVPSQYDTKHHAPWSMAPSNILHHGTKEHIVPWHQYHMTPLQWCSTFISPWVLQYGTSFHCILQCGTITVGYHKNKAMGDVQHSSPRLPIARCMDGTSVPKVRLTKQLSLLVEQLVERWSEKQAPASLLHLQVDLTNAEVAHHGNKPSQCGTGEHWTAVDRWLHKVTGQWQSQWRCWQIDRWPKTTSCHSKRILLLATVSQNWIQWCPFLCAVMSCCREESLVCTQHRAAASPEKPPVPLSHFQLVSAENALHSLPPSSPPPHLHPSPFNSHTSISDQSISLPLCTSNVSSLHRSPTRSSPAPLPAARGALAAQVKRRRRRRRRGRRRYLAEGSAGGRWVPHRAAHAILRIRIHSDPVWTAYNTTHSTYNLHNIYKCK